MITCTLRHGVDPGALAVCACFRLRKIPVMGGVHHGDHVPHEGPNDIARCHVSFPPLAACEAHREPMREDAGCLRACEHAKRTRCIRRRDRSFTRPVMHGATPEALGL